MSGNPHPVFPDGVPVEKANARAYLPLRLGNPDALRALDGSTFWLCYIQTLLAFFYRDTSDTTSEDNGTSVIVDGNGGIWKFISSGSGIAINAAGPVADRGDFDTEDPGFTYFGTDTELLYVRLTAGGWSDGSTIVGPAGPAGADGADGTNGTNGTNGTDGADGRNFEPDEVVPDLTSRSTYDAEAKNFAVLVESDSSNSDLPTLYFKESATSGDWSTGFTFSGGGGSVDETANYDWTGQHTFTKAIEVNPTTATTGQGIAITQEPSGTSTSSAYYAYNYIAIDNDDADTDGITGANLAFSVTANFGGSNMKGARIGSYTRVNLTAASSSSNLAKEYVGVSAYAVALSADGGTDTGSGAAGSIFASNFVAATTNNITNLLGVVGSEVNILLRSGSTANRKIGWNIVAGADDAVQGAVWDAAYSVSSQSGAVGWKDGLLFSNANGQFPIASTGNIIRATTGNAAAGIDFNAVTFSSFAIRTKGFVVGITGNINVGTAGSSTGVVSFANGTSGSVSVQPVSGALGSSILSLPAKTGTVATVADVGWVLLKTLTASNSATLEDASVFTSAYDDYAFVYDNLVPVTNAQAIYARIQSGGTYQTTGYLNSTAATTLIDFGVTSLSNTAGMGLSGVAYLHNVNSTTEVKTLISHSAAYSSTGPALTLTNNVGAWNGGMGAVTGVRFLANSGNISTGNIKIYGIRKT
jgi:hypothetical protein